MNAPAGDPEEPEVRLDTTPYGDSAILVRAIGGTEEQRWRTVQHVADRLGSQDDVGLENVVATYDSVLVEFDCDLVGHDDIGHAVQQAAGALTAETLDAGIIARRPCTFRIPVAYGGEYGPDLDDVAAQLRLTTDTVIQLHTSTEWVIRFRGAPAGAPMLDGSPFPGPVSRRPQPRIRVPAGSVALAGLHGVVYPVVSPGGWRLIGRTPLRLVDIHRRSPMHYRPGDRVRFVPLEPAHWAEFAGARLEPGHA